MENKITIELTPELKSWYRMTKRLSTVIKRKDLSKAHLGELQILDSIERVMFPGKEMDVERS